MADKRHFRQSRASRNGHFADHDATQPDDALVESWDERELVGYVAQELADHPYDTGLLYRPVFRQRLAEVRRGNPPLYFGKVLQAVGNAMRDRVRDWDREIESLALAQTELDIVALSQVEREDITWLWYPYVPLKKLTMMEGDPSSGKTYLILAIAAGITQGFALPDQEGRVGNPSAENKGNVLYITAEDGLGDTIRPRAEKVGADLDHLFVPREPQSFSIAEPHILSNALERFRPKLLVLDPLQAFLGASVDMHRANEVRPLMTNLLALAIQYECAIIMVRHWTKQSGGKARHRGQGNVDFAAAARSQLSVGESPYESGMRVMAQAKISLAGLGTSMVFAITDDGLEWSGTSTITADELSAAQPQVQHLQRKDAMQWLKAYLKDGPQPSLMVIHDAEKAGIHEKTLRRAKEHLGVLATKDDKVWLWRLPSFQKWERERYPGQEDDL
jgi:RecA/RadA recombinase